MVFLDDCGDNDNVMEQEGRMVMMEDVVGQPH